MPVRVLIIDDHDGFRSWARALLEADGYEVLEAVDGASALSAIGDANPQVILLDIQLPDIDGFEVARRLGEEGLGDAVILISTRDAADYGGQVAASGARGFIAKEELSGARIRSILERA